MESLMLSPSSVAASASEEAAEGVRRGVAAPSRSFRLRSESLNAVRLRRVFDIFDSDGDGEITVDEIALALDRLGLGADCAELAATVAAFVPPGRAGLLFPDFNALHRALGDALFAGPPSPSPATEEEELFCITDDQEEEDMKEAFRVFDEDGDGFISAAELQVVLGKLGLPEAKSLARVREMICSVDQDHDGRVNFGEFKCMMQGISVKGA
ncbi:probable calcium-binding protein CML27 isoform X2 [Ananas comosus]|uniref:Probable calcium-binding protein CML27 isoform X2 n=1 Tax=Ananas comosus TaxID=4615 RepID=A0A6P5EQK3_ANACO|nr:probable calcium-binding protein CML27 isoform X2 [Ananas comosus]